MEGYSILRLFLLKWADVCVHIKILYRHNFGWGAYCITLKKTPTPAKKKIMQKFNGIDTFLY